MSEQFRIDRKICFQNTFYTKCINVITDSIGRSIILRSIYWVYLISFAFCYPTMSILIAFLIISGPSSPTSKTPFKLRFAGGPMVAQH